MGIELNFSLATNFEWNFRVYSPKVGNDRSGGAP